MSLEDRLARLGLAHLIAKPEELKKALEALDRERAKVEARPAPGEGDASPSPKASKPKR